MFGFGSPKDWFDVLLVPAVGGAIALFWPKLQKRDKRKRFETLIARELEEIAPFPKGRDSTLWGLWGQIFIFDIGNLPRDQPELF
jgi:hypothetical protein